MSNVPPSIAQIDRELLAAIHSLADDKVPLEEMKERLDRIQAEAKEKYRKAMQDLNAH